MRRWSPCPLAALLVILQNGLCLSNQAFYEHCSRIKKAARTMPDGDVIVACFLLRRFADRRPRLRPEEMLFPPNLEIFFPAKDLRG